MCNIIMLIFGIIALVKGSFSLTGNKVVSGLPARIVGVILIMPMPISLGVGFVYGLTLAATKQNIRDDSLQGAAIVIELSIMAVCLVTALVVAFANAKPRARPASYAPPPLDEAEERARDDFRDTPE
jgi:hypothetical protein